MTLEWWHWEIAGLALVLLELAVPAFFVIWFGLGALLVGLALLVAPLGATAQVALWIVASVAMVMTTKISTAIAMARPSDANTLYFLD